MLKNIRLWSPIFTVCPFHYVLIFTEINDFTDSQIMLFYGILDVIAVSSFRIMKQWRADEELWNIDVHRWVVQVGQHKHRAIYILMRSSMRWCLDLCCSFHSFWPIPTVLSAERSGVLDFSHRIKRKLMQVKLCHSASTHVNWLVGTCRPLNPSFPRSYNPYLSSCLHQTGFRAK